MNCSEVKELLSAYYDDTLPAGGRQAVGEHVQGCDDCSRELAAFRGLSAMAAGFAAPGPPAHLWQQIEDQLEDRGAGFQPAGESGAGFQPAGESGVGFQPASENGVGFQPASGWLARFRQAGSLPHVRFALAIAALVLIAIGLVVYQGGLKSGGEPPFAATFDKYLDEFRRDPDSAQQLLLAEYDGQAVDAEFTVQTVGYRPLLARGLPEGYAVDSTYVVKMPCCTCVQCVGRRSDGSTIAVFEHCVCPPGEHGGAMGDDTVCDGTECGLMDLNDRIAASWTHGDRHFTAIGVRDKAEVDQLVVWFD